MKIKLISLKFSKYPLLLTIVLFIACGKDHRMEQSSEKYEMLRNDMVENQIISRGVKDPLVIKAMKTVPRHLFIPKNEATYAYLDEPRPIGEGQTISQPYIVAFMTEQLHLKPHYRVLEIGTGSGYQAAILAQIVDIIVTAAPSKIPPPLLEQLKNGGRMVLPVGEYVQELVVVDKNESGISMENVLPVRFVPMTGKIQEND